MRLRGKLIIAVFTATSVAITGGVLLTRRFFDQKLREVEEQTAEGDLHELRVVLERQMTAGHDRESIQTLVDEIGRAHGVTWVAILDPHGTIQVSSDRAPGFQQFPADSPERRYLDDWQETRRSEVHATIATCDTLRAIMPAMNSQPCWRCHGSHHALNGMMIVDRSLKPLHRTMAAATGRLVLGGVVALALILGTLGLVFERGVLRRLQQLRVATRGLGAGDLGARAPAAGADELGEVGREFNAMASRLQGALVQLAAERGRLDGLVNGISDGIVLLDLEGRVLLANSAFASRMRGEVTSGACHREVLRAAGVTEEQELPSEAALRDGALRKSIIPVEGGRVEEVYAQPLVAAGRTTGVIEVWRDITDRKRLEASVEQSERMAGLGMLASSIAHEVGNPLASIVTAVDAMLGAAPPLDGAQDGAQDDEHRAYLEVVRKQAFRCRRVTERLLGFARVPS